MTETTLEKQSREKAFNLIKKAKFITLLTHQIPDYDGMSACAALAYICQFLKKSVEIIYPNKPLQYLSHQSEIVSINCHTQEPDLIIICDTANYARCYFPEKFKHSNVINIDHHISNSIDGTSNLINPKASSTCEELFDIITSWDATLMSRDIAECLLLGILYDTQLLQTQSTTSKTLRVVAELMDYGIAIEPLKKELLSYKTYAIIPLWGEVLARVKKTKNDSAMWTYITQKDLENFKLDDVALIGFSNFFGDIGPIDISIVFYEMPSGLIKISLRSHVHDVNALANKFGGGGHKYAAGIMSSKPLSIIMHDLIEAIGDN